MATLNTSELETYRHIKEIPVIGKKMEIKPMCAQGIDNNSTQQLMPYNRVFDRSACRR